MRKIALTQDNEDPWTHIAVAAARVLERCDEQQKDRERDAQSKREDEADAEQQCKGIDKRLLYAGIKGRP